MATPSLARSPSRSSRPSPFGHFQPPIPSSFADDDVRKARRRRQTRRLGPQRPRNKAGNPRRAPPLHPPPARLHRHEQAPRERLPAASRPVPVTISPRPRAVDPRQHPPPWIQPGRGAIAVDHRVRATPGFPSPRPARCVAGPALHRHMGPHRTPWRCKLPSTKTPHRFAEHRRDQPPPGLSQPHQPGRDIARRAAETGKGRSAAGHAFPGLRVDIHAPRPSTCNRSRPDPVIAALSRLSDHQPRTGFDKRRTGWQSPARPILASGGINEGGRTMATGDEAAYAARARWRQAEAGASSAVVAAGLVGDWHASGAAAVERWTSWRGALSRTPNRAALSAQTGPIRAGPLLTRRLQEMARAEGVRADGIRRPSFV